MMSEAEDRFSLARAGLSTCGRAKKPMSYQSNAGKVDVRQTSLSQ